MGQIFPEEANHRTPVMNSGSTDMSNDIVSISNYCFTGQWKGFKSK